jgi:hypothetical protein
VIAVADRKTEPQTEADRDMPLETVSQPDPMLRAGRASLLRELLVALGIIIILSIVFYGLTSLPNNSQTGPSSAATNVSPAPTSGTTGQAPSTPQPPAPARQSGQSGAGNPGSPQQQKPPQGQTPQVPSAAGQGTH